MNDRDPIDEKISGLVRSVAKDVPSALDAEIRRRIADLEPRRPRRFLRHPLVWALLPSGAAMIAAAFIMTRMPARPVLSPISEIRTQFEIKDKNITIVFIQKPDFELFKEN